jgi:predicted DNA-binding transcriptional regulator AlpA
MMKTMESNALISTPEFAKIVGNARATIQRYIEEGILPYEDVVRYPQENRKRYKLSRQLAEDIRDKGWEQAMLSYKERHSENGQ